MSSQNLEAKFASKKSVEEKKDKNTLVIIIIPYHNDRNK